MSVVVVVVTTVTVVVAVGLVPSSFCTDRLADSAMLGGGVPPPAHMR